MNLRQQKERVDFLERRLCAVGDKIQEAEGELELLQEKAEKIETEIKAIEKASIEAQLQDFTDTFEIMTETGMTIVKGKILHEYFGVSLDPHKDAFHLSHLPTGRRIVSSAWVSRLEDVVKMALETEMDWSRRAASTPPGFEAKVWKIADGREEEEA